MNNEEIIAWGKHLYNQAKLCDDFNTDKCEGCHEDKSECPIYEVWFN